MSTGVAHATINACRGIAGESARALDDLVRDGTITYVPMPEALAGKYQSFTEADLSKLRAAGYPGEFMDVDRGVAAYVKDLQGK